MHHKVLLHGALAEWQPVRDGAGFSEQHTVAIIVPTGVGGITALLSRMVGNTSHPTGPPVSSTSPRLLASPSANKP